MVEAIAIGTLEEDAATAAMAAEEAAARLEPADEDVEELLIEDLSIDGMCGVY